MNSSADSQPTESHGPIGVVEEMTTNQAIGWVAGPADQFPVRVDLCLNDLVVMTTWADHPSTANTTGGAKGFLFTIRDLWSYVSVSDQVSFRIDGKPIPISGKGTFKRRGTDGAHTIEDLRKKFADGFVFDRSGRLRLSKKLDTAWQAQVMNLYSSVADVVKATTGYDIFVFYGSLLGQVREGGFIGHDNDFDTAYLSNLTDGPTAAAELRDIAFALIDAGLDVECRFSALHIHDSADPKLRIDLFHIYFDGDDNLALPFGRSGDLEFRRDDWHGVTEGMMADHKVGVPANAEKLVAHLYGENWKVPQAGFSWEHARTTRDRTGLVPRRFRESVYWTNFYARNEFTSGSTFFDKVNARKDVPGTVLDIGSGDGRDSFAFAKAGRRATGLDRSVVGVEHATKKAEQAGLSEFLRFATCDVSDVEGLRDAMKNARDQADGGPILFYLRFFLHSIPENVQESLMKTLAECAREGDFLAAEFRTDKDEANVKTYGKHYRRFQNGPAFGRSLTQQFGFAVLEEQEGTGLSVYKDEDPALYRVIARRGDSPSGGPGRMKQSLRSLARRTRG